ATVALNAAKNAGIIAAQIIGTFDKKISEKISIYKIQLEKSVLDKAKHISNEWQNNFDKE
ncbi:MAG: 5-(carboxyamino)imidazole ribonucleotide mutase, partial [Parafilimonas sp.]